MNNVKKTDYELFARYKLPCNITVNENGLFFVLKTVNMKKNRYDIELCRLDDKEPQPIAELGSPVYWQLEDRIAFIEKADPKKAEKRALPETVIRTVGYDGKGKRELCRLDFNVNEILFIDEENFFFTVTESARVLEAIEANGGNRRKAEKQLIADRDYMVFTEMPFWLNGAGVIDGQRSRLFKYQKGKVSPITDSITDVSGLTASADRKRIVFKAESFKEKSGLYNRLYCLNTEDGSVVDITLADNLSHGRCSFLLDGRLAFVASDMEEYGLNQSGDVYIYDFQKQQATLLYRNRDYEFGCSLNSDISSGRSLPTPFYEGGDRIFTVITDNDRSLIAGINKHSGEVTKLCDAPGMVSEAVLWGDSFYTVSHRGLNGPELCKIDFGGNETRLSWLNAGIAIDYDFSHPVEVSFTNEKGDTIYGFALPPLERKEGVKYKTVLAVHGGPRTAYGTNLIHEMQLLCACGYAVIFCNPTGSDGRGDAFADIRGKYGDIDFRDLMSFCDVCAERLDFVDGENMAIIGGSYGGFMTNWVIGHTDRFKAAVSQRSISNWITFSCTSDIGDYFGPDQTAGDIWQSHDKMWAQSPLRYADKVKTPTLFIHSDKDFRCPLSEGISMYSALKHFGVPSRMCVFKGETHELSRSGLPLHRIRRLKEIVGWLDKYMS